MVFFVILVATVLLFICCSWANENDYNVLSLLTGFLGAVGGVTLVVMFFVLVGNHLGVQGEIALHQTTYDSLTFQAENHLYENDNDIGKKELANQIQEWNEDLAYKKKAQRDFWIGIFYPNIYDQFDLISMDVLKEEAE